MKTLSDSTATPRFFGGLYFPPPTEKRCQARNRRGERCGAWAVKGQQQLGNVSMAIVLGKAENGKG